MLSKSMWITAFISAAILLLMLIPVAVGLYWHWPPKIVTVNVQALVEAQQKYLQTTLGKGRDAADSAQRAETQTVAFAKRLSATIDALRDECQCVVLNKAALLSGPEVDYTDWVRERLGS